MEWIMYVCVFFLKKHEEIRCSATSLLLALPIPTPQEQLIAVSASISFSAQSYRNQEALVCVCVCVCVCVLSRSVISSLCDPMDCSPPGSAVHGIVQARILQWVAISFSRGSSWPRVLTCVSCVFCIDRWTLYHWTTGEAQDTLITQVTKPLLSRGEVSRPQPHLMPWNVSPAMRLCAKHQGRTLCSSKLQSPQCISLPNHPLYMVALLPLSPYLSILLPTTTSDMQDP